MIFIALRELSAGVVPTWTLPSMETFDNKAVFWNESCHQWQVFNGSSNFATSLCMLGVSQSCQ